MHAARATVRPSSAPPRAGVTAVRACASPICSYSVLHGCIQTCAQSLANRACASASHALPLGTTARCDAHVRPSHAALRACTRCARTPVRLRPSPPCHREQATLRACTR
eukprot:439344-Pleurochrysis_carterae.AAC.1